MVIAHKRKRVVKPAHHRRRELLEAAVRVFARKPVSQTTVADITREAGVAKGTFYLYFVSKEHLLAALREQFVEDWLGHFNELWEHVGRDDWWTLVELVIASNVDYWLERQDIVRVFAREGYTPQTVPILAECERKLNMMLAAGIQAGIDAGAFHVSDPPMTATLVHYALEGTLHEGILYGGPVDRDRLVAAATEMVRKVLKPAPGETPPPS